MPKCPPLLVLCASLILAGCSSTVQEAPTWIPSPTLVSKLGSRLHVAGGYSFRVPRAYKMLTSSEQDGGSQYIWCRDAAGGGGPNTASLALIIGKKLERQDDLSTPQILGSLYNAFGRNLSAGVTGFTMSPPELGTVNGMKFVRGTWAGTSGGQNQQGNLYATVDNQAGLCLLSTVPALDNEARQITEAAILTFKGQPRTTAVTDSASTQDPADGGSQSTPTPQNSRY